MQKNIDDNKIIFPKNINGSPMYKRHRSEVKSTLKPMSTLLGDFLNATATKELRTLLDGQYFDYPKSVELLKIIVNQSTRKDDIILDFFAGSGTAGHAVMALNQEDEGNRKYILVQLPESTDEKSEAYKAGYKKISDITKERLKRVMKKLDYKEGFKSFYLDNSNFQVFKEVKKHPNESYEAIEKMLKMSMFHENILTQGAKPLDLVYEVGLKNGFSLSAKVDEVKKEPYSFITLSEEDRMFYFSFDKKIELNILDSLPNGVKLICYEKSLTTNVKLNLRENLDLEVL
ncbi:MAG: Type III restriction-modification system methylation subunit (EC [uncultured Sulfurovum sp.]|uniref:Type III restriction-modification system methylation subunit (EC) n=1 Tax=uncultured Sulfurovum sp. TaxID=269237 RepID=A0A6S6T0T7_9BACT|nr:MAG: Type III restriction-modification system methylation subunit (EC [uncultured Sulfurovum sp.]